jgi:VanZ family protein
MYWLSSIPDLAAAASHPLVLLAANVSHAPMFALLAFCWLKTISAGREISGAAYALAFVASAVCALVDEWRQSAVPGRHPSVGDMILDFAGISTTLGIVRLTTGRQHSARTPLDIKET